MTVHPPITAVQHTRCLLALTAITAFIDQLKPTTHTTSLDSHIHKITRWRDACKPSVKIKTLSAGARRDLDAAFTALAEQTITHGLDGEALFQRWAASIWTALTLLEDCKNTCPAYFKGRGWRYLLQTLNTLAMGMYKLEPEIAETGTKLYERVAL